MKLSLIALLKHRNTIMLLGTFKNYGLVRGLAIFFFNDETALPATVTSVVGIFYIVWLEAKKKWR
jgi:hypothetical protein